MAEKRTGFIQNLSPTKKTKYGDTSFRFDLQDSVKSSENILGFGNRNHSILQEFVVKKSPVKINFTRNEKYNSLIFNERNNCTIAKGKEVPFEFVPLEGSSYSGLSMMTTIKTLNTSSPDNSKYFTVRGKIFLGPNPPKTINTGKVVKEDIKFADESGTISIHVWEPTLFLIKNDACFELTHNKLRKFMGQLYLTTTPSTQCKIIDNLTAVLNEANFSSIVKVVIQQLDSIGEIEKFCSCKGCKKKINSLNWKKNVRCDNCKKTYRIADLEETATVQIIFTLENTTTTVTATKDVLAAVVNILDDEECVIDQLLDLHNVSVEYNSETNMVFKFEQEKEKLDQLKDIEKEEEEEEE